jgi:hypothetical protein
MAGGEAGYDGALDWLIFLVAAPLALVTILLVLLIAYMVFPIKDAGSSPPAGPR